VIIKKIHTGLSRFCATVEATWIGHAKLSGLPSVLTNKIRSNYTKDIKKKLEMSHGNYQKL
jgi:hypothetical protein